MKKILLALFVYVGFQGKAQIVLEHQYYAYHKDFYILDIGNNDYKYVIQDSTGFSLYNLDHSPYLLNVVPPIPIWVPPTYYEVSYITKSLFDCDTTNIEYALTRGGSPSNYYIYRTDGTLLIQIDSVTGSYCFGCFDGSLILQPIVNTPNGTKLILQHNTNQAYDSVYVYSLCGTLPESISGIPFDNNFVLVFPNPANGIINFQINLPNNRMNFKLTIYNSSFQKVDESIINGKNYQLDIKQKSLAAGTYLFDLKAGFKVFQTGKFIVTK